MNQICLKCKLSYITKKQGIVVEELADFGSYRLWSADLKECPKCNHQIVSGFASSPFAEHYQKGYKGKLEELRVRGVYEWREK